jgi:hypothetical protein
LILASKPPEICRILPHTVRRSDRAWSGFWVHQPPAGGRLCLIQIILGKVHDFAGDLRAVFAVCITPRLLEAMIIGS